MESLKEMFASVEKAKKTQENFNMMRCRLVNLLHGNLRGINGYHLAKLKKELSQFNAKTYEWKN